MYRFEYNPETIEIAMFFPIKGRKWSTLNVENCFISFYNKRSRSFRLKKEGGMANEYSVADIFCSDS